MDFSGNQFAKEVIIMAVRCYLAYALSYRSIEADQRLEYWTEALFSPTLGS